MLQSRASSDADITARSLTRHGGTGTSRADPQSTWHDICLSQQFSTPSDCKEIALHRLTASVVVGDILCMIACLLFRPTKKSLVEGVRKQALRQGCSVVLRRFFADFELRQNASGVRYHHHHQHPAAENLTVSLLHCTVRRTRELPRLYCDTSTFYCLNTSPLLPTLRSEGTDAWQRLALGLELRLSESVPRSIERLCIQAHSLISPISCLPKT